MITESLSKVFGWKTGHLLTEGFQVKCAGVVDINVSDYPGLVRHLICTLDDHLEGTQAHAVGNPEFTDALWILSPDQTSIDWSNPVCQICQQGIAP